MNEYIMQLTMGSFLISAGVAWLCWDKIREARLRRDLAEFRLELANSTASEDTSKSLDCFLDASIRHASKLNITTFIFAILEKPKHDEHDELDRVLAEPASSVIANKVAHRMFQFVMFETFGGVVLMSIVATFTGWQKCKDRLFSNDSPLVVTRAFGSEMWAA